MEKKKLDKSAYETMFKSWFKRFLQDPLGFADRAKFKLFEGECKREMREDMAEAMAIWSLLNSKSNYYSKIYEHLREKAKRKKVAFDSNIFVSLREKQIQAMQDEVAELKFISSGNVYSQALCMYLLLPATVARKWLWHYNVDFQSVEGLLRRLTANQFASLRLHYNMVQDGTPENELPCFTEGMANKIWRFFRPDYQHTDRMATKAAIAHNFFGMDMGFKLYPDPTEDEKIDQGLASQFLSKRERDSGDFEVSKEHGGTYWLLYKKLRSNSLYGEGKDVRLGRWICPGFWFTMILWSVFALLSPSCFAAALGLCLFTGTAPALLIGVGAITPTILLAMGIRRVCGKTYDSGYWERFFGAFLVTAVVACGYVLIRTFKEYPSFYVGIVTLIFLVPYCEKNDTLGFWRAPVMGKLFPALFLSILSFDLYLHTMFFQFCWDVIVGVWGVITSIAEFLWEKRYWILAIIVYAVVIGCLMAFSNWKLKKTDAMIKQKYVGVRFFERMLMGVSIAIMLAVMGLYLYVAMVYDLNRSVWMILMAIVPLAFVATYDQVYRGADNRIKEKFEGLLSGVVNLTDEQIRKLHPAILSNSFWFDIEKMETRGEKFGNFLASFLTCSNSWNGWAAAFARAVKTDEELEKLTSYRGESLTHILPYEVVPELLDLILRGEPENVLCDFIRGYIRPYSEEVHKSSFRSLVAGKISDILLVSVEWISDVFWERILGPLIRITTWPIRTIWKGICDAWRMWQAFNEQCPPSPPENRPLAR